MEVEDPTSDTIEDDDFQDNQQLGLDMPKKNWISQQSKYLPSNKP